LSTASWCLMERRGAEWLFYIQMLMII
jgi:hypothetical protein